ncbi:MAG: hypothetical protein J6Y85_04925 [Alphaproteobacteria bacterium]|nr:hypothetical protein [Alphaproteobacteria bacterium]
MSIAQIKSNYKNCTNCGATKDSDGQRTYYCTCCGEKSEATCTSSQYIVNNQCKACPAKATCDGTTARCRFQYKRLESNGVVACVTSEKFCQKQGSHVSIAYIKEHLKTVINVGPKA